MIKLFTKHPASIGEGYFQHMRFAMKCSWKLFWGALGIFIHAIFPFLFMSTGCNTVAKLTAYFCHENRKDGFMKKVKCCLDNDYLSNENEEKKG